MKKSQLKALIKEVIKESIHDSELFFWNSRLPKARQTEILQWVNSLSKEQQSMIQDIHSEGIDEGAYTESESHNYDNDRDDV